MVAKKGWKTSEFWVTLVPVAAVLLSIFGVEIDTAATNEAVLAVSAGTAGIYAAVRTWLKVNRIKYAENVIDPDSESHETYPQPQPLTPNYVAADDADKTVQL